MTRAARAGGGVLVVLLAVELVLWEAFFVPLRVGGVPVPVAVVVAGAGNLVLGTAGGRLLGRAGAAVPGLLWFALAGLLTTRRPEGDLIVTGSASGLVFLLVGTVAAAVAVGRATPRRPARSDPSP